MGSSGTWISWNVASISVAFLLRKITVPLPVHSPSDKSTVSRFPEPRENQGDIDVLLAAKHFTVTDSF